MLHLHLADDFGLVEGWIVGEEGFGGVESQGLETGLEQFFRHLAPFHDEEAEFLAELLLSQGGDLFYGVFGNHWIIIDPLCVIASEVKQSRVVCLDCFVVPPRNDDASKVRKKAAP